MMRRSVMSLGRTWLSTMLMRCCLGSIIEVACKVAGACRRRLHRPPGAAPHLSPNLAAAASARKARGCRSCRRGSNRPAIATRKRRMIHARPQGPRGGVVTQRIANPRTPVRFRAWPPGSFQKFSTCPSLWRAWRARGAGLVGVGTIVRCFSSHRGKTTNVRSVRRRSPHLQGCDSGCRAHSARLIRLEPFELEQRAASVCHREVGSGGPRGSSSRVGSSDPSRVRGSAEPGESQ